MNSIHVDRTNTGFGAEPQRGVGGQSPPTAKPSNNFTSQVQLLRSHHVYATSIKILNVHTHHYLYRYSFCNYSFIYYSFLLKRRRNNTVQLRTLFSLSLEIYMLQNFRLYGWIDAAEGMNTE